MRGSLRRAVLPITVTTLLCAATVLTTGSAAAAGSGGSLSVEVLSSRADQVSGGDALLRVRLSAGDPGDLRVLAGGRDVTAAFHADPGGRSWTGRVDGLRLGWTTVRAHARGGDARIRLRNFPISGPIFSGPQQQPFLCTTERNGLGQPKVDNQDREGMRVFAVDDSGQKTDQVVGWSRDCGGATVVDYLYRSTDGRFKPLPGGGERPADLASTTTLDGKTVDYVVRRERGTINRFVYAVTMLAPLGESAGAGRADNETGGWDDSAWNRRVIYRFDGGVAIGHTQGSLSTDGTLYHPGLSKGTPSSTRAAPVPTPTTT